jgi:tetratricopeptide (TPR) repeat protein/transcriptional regulator with XRE-family HTH domain
MLAMPNGGVTNGAANRGRLARRRKAVGLTQEQLAEQLGVERTTVVRWERGETQPLPWLRPKLARALGVSADSMEELLAFGGVPASPPSRAAVPRQLPAAVADFTGRAAELRALTRMLDQAEAGAPGTVVISAIGGTAGVGKTALALHWAHQVADRFEDGQLHVNLRGFDPCGTPLTAAEAIRGFLDALGVPPERIPASPKAQAGLYRSLLSGQRVLLLLDNARDEQQVRPLLPASPACLVIVTSRNQLPGLAAADGARLLTLDTLAHAEAVHLLTARLGGDRAAEEPGAVDHIASLCACLPLALAVAAARAAARPSFPLTALAAELGDSAGRLDALDIGDPAGSIRGVFSWSYGQLDDESARMFRLLGLHPGPDISVPAAASLASTDESAARRMLGELTRECLVAEHAPGRYACHDLLRAYAADRARAADDGQARAGATARALDHYLHSAHTAALLMNPERDPIALSPRSPGVTSEHLADHQQALAWFEAEHQVLIAALTLAADTGFDTHAWQIPWAMADFLDRRGHWYQWAAIQRTAVAAATRLGDTAGQAEALRLQALACERMGDHDQALAHGTAGLHLSRQLGDRLGEAQAHQFLALASHGQSRHADALAHAEEALRLYQGEGHRPGQTQALTHLGWIHALLGNYRQAREFCQQALTLTADPGFCGVERFTWYALGYAEYHLGNFAKSAACYERALSIAREFGNLPFEAEILTRLGTTFHASGQLSLASNAWRQALVILDALHHPDDEQVRATLASISNPRHPQPPAAG